MNYKNLYIKVYLQRTLFFTSIKYKVNKKMAKYRLSALTIFIILLAVLLIGYLMHHKWENFQSKMKEGFHTDYTTSTLAQTLDGYSVNNKKVVKLYDDIYFDPVSKALIKNAPGELVMKKKDGTEVKHTFENSFKLESMGAGKVIHSGLESRMIFSSSTGFDDYPNNANEAFTGNNSTTVPTITLTSAKTRVQNALSKNMDILYATFTFDSAPAQGKTIESDDTIKIKTIEVFVADGVKPSVSGENYPVLDSDETSYTAEYPWRFKILSETDNFDVAGVVTTTAPRNIAWKTDKEVAIISMPLVIPNPIDSKNNSHSVTFIHVMDMKNNKHVATYYFNGNQVEKYTYNKKIVDTIASDKTIYDYTSGTKTDFSGEIKNISTPYYTSQEEIKTDVSHNTEAKSIYLAARVGDNMVRANIKVTASTITIDAAEVSHAQSSADSSSSTGTSTDSSSSTDTSTDTTDTSSSSCPSSTSTTSNVSPSNSTDTNSKFSELTSTLALMKTMKSLFSSSDNDYFLKTEVVPPVCPTCPSCSHSDGVCTNCGGNGGSGTRVSNGNGNGNGNGNDSVTSLARDAGTGATNLARDAASGATNLARDAVSGADSLARDAASGTVDVASNAVSATYSAAEDVAGSASNLARDAASGTYKTAQSTASSTYGAAKDVAGGAYSAAKDVAGGAYGATKDVAGGAYGAAKDVTSGAYGAAKDITQGTVGLGRDFASGVGNLFGAGPTSQSGGYQNSYGGPSYNHNQGGYMNPRQYTSHGQDPYSYYGAVPPRSNGCNFVPRTANFSSFGR